MMMVVQPCTTPAAKNLVYIAQAAVSKAATPESTPSQVAKRSGTTEKDVMNLPADTEALLAPVQLLWLKLDMEVENGAELVDLVLRTIRAKATA